VTYLICFARQQLVTELQIDERERHNRLKEEYSSLLTENVSIQPIAKPGLELSVFKILVLLTGWSL